MKNSIRMQVFTIFSIIMVVFILFGFLINTFMLEKYYVYKNKVLFQTAYERIIDTISSGENLQESIEQIDREEGISIVVVGGDSFKVHVSFHRNRDNIKLLREIRVLIRNMNSMDVKKPIYRKIEGLDNTVVRLLYAVKTPKDEYIILTKPLKGIKENARIALEFYIISGAVALFFGSLFMLKFSKKLTKPIVEMSEITEEISKLNFDRKLDVKSNDELSILAGSINTLSEKLETSINNLKGDIAFQKTLSRNISHELKTPISVIKGYAEGLIFDVANSNEMRKHYLHTIVKECDKMDGLIKEMLMLSKLNAKDYVLSDITTFTSDTVINDIRERFKYQIESNQINFKVDCLKPLSITANYDLLMRALENLISNAIKYCDEKKNVTLGFSEDEHLRMSVYNSGDAIAENEQAKIFDEFYKVDKVRNRTQGGHGLGLSIVNSIANLHQGSIEVKNVEDGVVFTLTIAKKLG